MKVSKEQYEFAQNKVEELLPLVSDEMSANDPLAVELALMSDVVIAYEKEHFPIEKPTVAELIELSLAEKEMTQKQLAVQVGVSHPELRVTFLFSHSIKFMRWTY